MMSLNQQITSQFKARIRSQIDDAGTFFQGLEIKKVKSRHLSEFPEFEGDGLLIQQLNEKFYAFHENEWNIFKRLTFQER